jgi:methyl acetate hydrolase
MTDQVTPRTTTPERALAQATERGDVPGVVALAADRQDIVFQGAFGRQGPIDAAESPPASLDSLFMIASMTKAVTAVAALQLVERGVLHLDEPLGERLPELAATQVLEGFDEAGHPRLRPPRAPITMRRLLTHTAGFAYTTWNPALHRLEQHRGAPLGAFNQVLVFDPGERWEYGTNLDWAGRVIEHLSQQSLEAYFRANIFEPLGMRDTSYLMPPARRARAA